MTKLFTPQLTRRGAVAGQVARQIDGLSQVGHSNWSVNGPMKTFIRFWRAKVGAASLDGRQRPRRAAQMPHDVDAGPHFRLYTLSIRRFPFGGGV